MSSTDSIPTSTENRRDERDHVQAQRVFIIPRPVRDGGQVTTALRVAMAAAGVGVHKLERAAGVNHQTVQNLRAGKGGVERAKAQAIADALGVHPDELFCHKDGNPAAW